MYRCYRATLLGVQVTDHPALPNELGANTWWARLPAPEAELHAAHRAAEAASAAIIADEMRDVAAEYGEAPLTVAEAGAFVGIDLPLYTVPQPPPCHTCGCDGACYLMCPESRDYYSPERERADTLESDAMPYSEWYARAMREAGEGDGLDDDGDYDEPYRAEVADCERLAEEMGDAL